MPSIYEQLSVNTCVILEVQHNRRIPSQSDGVCLNTLVLLEYKEEEEEISLNIPPKPKNDGFRRPEGTKQNLRTEILKKIQEASVLPVEKKPMNEYFSWNLYWRRLTLTVLWITYLLSLQFCYNKFTSTMRLSSSSFVYNKDNNYKDDIVFKKIN